MSARWGRGAELTSSKIHSTLFAHRFVTIQYGFVALAGQTVIVIERLIRNFIHKKNCCPRSISTQFVQMMLTRSKIYSLCANVWEEEGERKHEGEYKTEKRKQTNRNGRLSTATIKLLNGNCVKWHEHKSHFRFYQRTKPFIKLPTNWWTNYFCLDRKPVFSLEVSIYTKTTFVCGGSFLSQAIWVQR